MDGWMDGRLDAGMDGDGNGDCGGGGYLVSLRARGVFTYALFLSWSTYLVFARHNRLGYSILPTSLPRYLPGRA